MIRMRLYTVDKVLDLMTDSYSVRAWRRWRAHRILARLPAATLRQADIVARHRGNQALSRLLGYEARFGDDLVLLAAHRPCRRSVFRHWRRARTTCPD